MMMNFRFDSLESITKLIADNDTKSKWVISADIFKTFCFTEQFTISFVDSGLDVISDFDLIQFAGNISDGKWTRITLEERENESISKWDKEDEAMKEIIKVYTENGFDICTEKGIWRQIGDDVQ